MCVCSFFYYSLDTTLADHNGTDLYIGVQSDVSTPIQGSSSGVEVSDILTPTSVLLQSAGVF